MTKLKKLLLVLTLIFPCLVCAEEKININTADKETLIIMLNGVGESRAEAIISYRKEHGGFKSVEELTEIRGIGPRLVENNRDILSVE